MKRIILIALTIQLVLISCEKEHEKDRECPVIAEVSVPADAKTAFNTKYTKLAADKWFDVGKGVYCASFELNGVKAMAEFKSDGTFIKQKSKSQNAKQDDDDDDECECEIEE